jgi:hypothetical protein
MFSWQASAVEKGHPYMNDGPFFDGPQGARSI